MKNVRRDFANSLVRLLLTCAGEDEGVNFVHYSTGNQLAAHKLGDCTYEIDNGNQIALRYWVSELRSIEEPISTPEERSDLQKLILQHLRTLKAKVDRLEE